VICDLTISRGRVCKGLGGLNEFYIFPFVKYSKSQIVTNGLTLTAFPTTTIFRFFLESTIFSNPMQEDGGGKFYNENISLTLPKIEVNTELTKLLFKDHRMIIRDRNEKYRMLGAFNGGIFDNLVQQTGSTHGDLSGYTINFEGVEELPALFLDDLSLFTVAPDNFLITEDGELLLTEDNQEIIIE